MTAPPLASNADRSTVRSTGLAAVACGVSGILAVGFLQVAVFRMIASDPPSFRAGESLFDAHDVAITFQSLFMIPVAFGIHALSRRSPHGARRTTLIVGVAALSLIVLCVLLSFLDVVAGDLYMVPQGVFGVWLMVVNRRLRGLLPHGITILGMVVGFGLLLVGSFPLAYGIFVDPIGLRGPVPPDHPSPDTMANRITHDVLVIGSILGVLTYPIWSILLGWRLLRARGV